MAKFQILLSHSGSLRQQTLIFSTAQCDKLHQGLFS